MIKQLKFGKEIIDVKLKDSTAELTVSEPAYNIDKESFCTLFASKLPADPSKYVNISVILSDKTRLCGYPAILPWITDVLLQKCAQKNNITFFIAYGTHPRQTEEESLSSYGNTYRQYKFVHHDCYDDAVFDVLGSSTRGTPITVRKDIRNSSLIITVGAISHHYFAAYGGGRKLLFPGLAKREAIYHNHGLFLDRENRILSEGCQPGKLDGNPIAEDLKEIDDALPPKISIHGILNSCGKLCRLLVGGDYKDFVEACELHDSYYRSKSSAQYDLVVASGGGYPKDINFIQAHKAVHNAAAFVKEGGRLVVLAECIDDIGSDYFMQYLEAGGFEQAFAKLEKNYEGNGGTALSMMTKTNRINIYMLTSLDEKTCKTLGVRKITKEEIQPLVDHEEGSVAVIGNASMLVR